MHEQSPESRLEEMVLMKNETEPIHRIIQRIHELSKKIRDRAVVVAMNGAAPRSGKTYISGEIIKALKTSSVPVFQSTDTRTVRTHDLQQMQENARSGRSKGVFLFAAEEEGMAFPSPEIVETYRDFKNIAVQKAFGDSRFSIDLWLATYHPDRPFRWPNVLADMLIRNEGANQQRR